jgi:hypothetical protein
MIALHCGYTEKDIDEISYIFYKDIITEITIHLNYSSVVHLLGRDYSDESTFDYVDKCSPMSIDSHGIKNDIKQPINSGKKVTMSTLRDFGML